jgi:betaine-aldehyde dehydrogenase
VRKVSLTGSVATGKKILSSVADKIIPVTLELGGKSPLILFDDTKLDQAVTGAMLANFFCQGEICSNGTRVFVQERLFDPFVKELLSRVRSFRIGNPLDPQTQMGALISKAQKEKVLGYIESGKKEGARLLYGGSSPELDAPYDSGFFLQPTIFSECSDEMTIVKEEIFGPVMSILCFKDEEEVVARANKTEFGLGAGVFTQNLQRAHRVVAQLQAGICWINNHNFAPAEIPFGAYKQSGLGRENGTAALDHYTQLKTVYVEMNDLPTYP